MQLQSFLFQVGDIVSVIDMPPYEESSWWRGKREFEVFSIILYLNNFEAECCCLMF